MSKMIWESIGNDIRGHAKLISFW